MTGQNTKNTRKKKNVRKPKKSKPDKSKKSKPDKSKKRIRKTCSKKQGGAKKPNANLWDGIYKNNYKKVEKAFNEGADINNQNNDGNTPIIHAIRSGDYDMVEFLLEMGADINTQNNDGNTPIIHAIDKKDYDMVELLLEMGAGINTRNNDGNTPLIHAINKEDNDIVELLLKMGADVTQKELLLAEGLTEWDEEQNGIPYLLEDEIREGRTNIRRKANDAVISVANDKVKNSPRKSIAKVLGQYVKYQDKNGDNNKVRPHADLIMRYAGIDKEYIDNNKL